MENSANHLDIINYLYDEMSPEEKRKFEEKMAHDSALKEEVEALLETRSLLGQLPDKEVVEPSVKTTSSLIHHNHDSFQWIKPLVSVAAVIVILLVAGYLTRFTLQYNEQGLFISFGANVNHQDRYAEKSEVDQLMKHALANQQVTFQKELAKTSDSLQTLYTLLAQFSQEKNNQRQITPSKAVSEAELKKQIADWQSVNQALLQNYIKTVSQQQQEYMQDVLVQFSDYLQQQRENDLIMIRQNLIDLKDYQDQQKQKTNQTLASIMKTVNQQK